jgi:hypothetical protein
MGVSTSRQATYQQFVNRTRQALDQELQSILEMYQQPFADPEVYIQKIKDRIKDRPEFKDYANNIDQLFGNDVRVHKEFKEMHKRYMDSGKGKFMEELGARMGRIMEKYTTALVYYIRATDIAVVVVPLILTKITSIIQLMARIAVSVNDTLKDVETALGQMETTVSYNDQKTLEKMRIASVAIMDNVTKVMATLEQSSNELRQLAI